LSRMEMISLVTQTLDFPFVGIRAGTDHKGQRLDAVLGQMKIFGGTREGLVSRPEVAPTGFRVGRRLINGSAGRSDLRSR
jgi:hypothetical protein